MLSDALGCRLIVRRTYICVDAMIDAQIGGVKTLAHLAFGNDVNRIEVRTYERWTFMRMYVCMYGVYRFRLCSSHPAVYPLGEHVTTGLYFRWISSTVLSEKRQVFGLRNECD